MRPLLARSLALALCAAPAWLGAQIVRDGSFEMATVTGNNVYQYDGFLPGPPVTPSPSFASPWAFAGGSGLIRGTGSSFNTPAPFPDGQQVAFLQGLGAAVQQNVTTPSAGAFQLTFSRAGRAATGNVDGNTTFNILFGGTLVGTRTTTSNSAWVTESILLSAAGGGATLRFENVSVPGDHTFFLDQVSITSVVPEPATVTLVAVGLLAIGARARRRRGAV